MRKLLLTFLLTCGSALASTNGGFGLSVLVDDNTRPEYAARGTMYVEALRGANYALRITNPTPYRVAVALSVDGLNTIDARHGDAWSAAKWILDPYESTVISGWQVNDHTARRFFFTNEDHSYGASLGQTENLGVIEAVFYRERQRKVQALAPPSSPSENKVSRQGGTLAQAAGATSTEDFAATGMGGRATHDVERVHIDLEKTPVASMRIRYEFRPQLVKLGVLPSMPSQLDRREHARGFESYCPEPK